MVVVIVVKVILDIGREAISHMEPTFLYPADQPVVHTAQLYTRQTSKLSTFRGFFYQPHTNKTPSRVCTYFCRLLCGTFSNVGKCKS